MWIMNGLSVTAFAVRIKRKGSVEELRLSTSRVIQLFLGKLFVSGPICFGRTSPELPEGVQ